NVGFGVAWLWSGSADVVADVEPCGVLHQAGELFVLDLRLEDDRGLDQDQQCALVLDGGVVAEQAVEYRDLGEDGDAGLDLDFTDQPLATDEEGALVGDADGGRHLCDLKDGDLDVTGGQVDDDV